LVSHVVMSKTNLTFCVGYHIAGLLTDNKG